MEASKDPAIFTVETVPNLGNWFVHSKDAERMVALCSRELDAKMIARALNAQRAATTTIRVA